MNMEQSKYLADLCNQYGVLVSAELNRIQHEFQLRLDQLSPSSVVYSKNKDHIPNTTYSLLPTNVAGKIKNAGRDLFRSSEYLNKSFKEISLTGYDYVRTTFGKYLRYDSINKFLRIKENTLSKVKKTAENTIKDNYDRYFFNSYVLAHDYFSGRMGEFKEIIEMYDGKMDLFWSDIAKLALELKFITHQFNALYPDKNLTIGYLSKLKGRGNLVGLMTVFKLSDIPKSKKEYIERLSFYHHFTGFHELSFKEWKWNDVFYQIQDFEGVRELLFREKSGIAKTKAS